MKEFKGTKGEWFLKGSSVYVKSNLLEENGDLMVASCFNTSLDVKKHNLKLIASAPELLEALKGLCETINSINKHNDDVLIERDIRRWEKAEKAISKALD